MTDSLRGLVQRKISVIVTFTFLPPPPTLDVSDFLLDLLMIINIMEHDSMYMTDYESHWRSMIIVVFVCSACRNLDTRSHCFVMKPFQKNASYACASVINNYHPPRAHAFYPVTNNLFRHMIC